MDTLKLKYLSGFFGILLIVLLAAFLLNVINSPKKPMSFDTNRSYYVIQDEDSKVLMETGIEIHV
ncbi:MAG TPA: hypothetical protein VFD02_01620, partial [Syntrophomonadaceae bacterium]|nr:hypothetical protein [Syntrophomonadaceae bacterium]